MKPLVYSIFAALALTGCVSTIPSKLSESHPANPHAPESPQAPANAMLLAGAEGLVLPVSTNQTKMQHGQHQMQPATGAQQPTEHKHEHDQKQEEKK